MTCRADSAPRNTVGMSIESAGKIIVRFHRCPVARPRQCPSFRPSRREATCNYRLFDRYNKKVMSMAVLGDDNPRWRPDRFGYRLWGMSAGLRYPVVKLLDFAKRRETLEQSSNPFALVVLAHLLTRQTRKDPQTRRASKLALLKGLYERGQSADDVRRLQAAGVPVDTVEGAGHFVHVDRPEALLALLAGRSPG